MSFHPTFDHEALRDDLVGLMTWAHERSVRGQISNFASTYSDYRSGNVTEAKAGARRGIGYALDTALMASGVGGSMAGGGIWSYRAYGAGKRLAKFHKGLAPTIFKGHILMEYLEGDLEWQDIPYYAAPLVAQLAWDRYTIKNKLSPSSSRSGNAGGGGGGKKTSKKKKHSTRPKRYLLGSKRVWKKGHNPCDKGYSPRKIKGKWHCVLK
jgi:hypothetical protein